MNGRPDLGSIAVKLREEFDRSFATAPRSAAALGEELLAVRVAGEPYALRLADVAAVHAPRRIVAVPSRAATLLGVAAFRGVVTPVHDLGAILRAPARPPDAGHRPALVLARSRASIAFAVDAIEGQRRVALEHEPGAAPIRLQDPEARPHVRGAIRVAGALRPLIDLASVVEALLASLGERRAPA